MPMPPTVDSPTLTGQLVTLEPLSHDHLEDLQRAAADGELWNLWYTSVPRPEAMASEIDRRLELAARGQMVPYATRRLSTGRVVGMTSYMAIDTSVPRLEIGHTWNARSAMRTGTNTESKLLLLSQAFEQWECAAVEFRTHWLNRQSRAAIERLGAKQDGVLRSHRRMPDGSLRDTVVYSIVASEWPGTANELRRRLADH